MPIIAMTASVLEKDREATSSAGMDGFSPKPVDMPLLVRELARVLELDAGNAASTGPQGALHVLNLGAGLRRWGEQEQPYYRALHAFVQDRMALGHQLAAMLDRLEHGWQQAGASADARRALDGMLAQANEQVAIACAAITTVLASQETPPAAAHAQPEAPVLDAARVRALARQLHDSIDSGAFDDALLHNFRKR